MLFDLILIAIMFAALSGTAGLFLSRRSAWGQRISVGMMIASALAGLTGAWLSLSGGSFSERGFIWPAAGNSIVGVDALSAFFLVPIFLIGGLGSVYGMGYWPQKRYPSGKLRFFWGLLTAGMALLVIAKHGMAFLLGWEVMALSAFFLVSTEDEHSECRQAGWIYLMATHVGTLTLFGLFVLWRWGTGSYALQPIRAGVLSDTVMNSLFFLALLGFGLKAGMMPLHFWLPGAHAAAPSHVSAFMSGVVLKMGIYGFLRLLSLLPDPPAAWGGLILLLGAVSGLLGVVFAVGQHDLKRLLAYHSVENIGIILMGAGLAMLGRAAGRPELVVLGMAGCLLHTWNHSLFKALLFLAAGAVVHETNTRRIDALGGLAKVMPWTAGMFLLGAAAICGLPPLNGFVSELFVYLGLLRTITTEGAAGSMAVTAAPVLAMIGALAVACFVKVYGAVFLGASRTSAAAHAHEPPITMLLPMIILAACCAIIGLAPILIVPVLEAAVAGWRLLPVSNSTGLGVLSPLSTIGAMSTALTLTVLLLMTALHFFKKSQRSAVTWDCGYSCPTSRMQYTSSSFAGTIVKIFARVLRPDVHSPRIEGIFPFPAAMRSHIDDVILDRTLIPAGHAVKRRFGWFHRFQQGLTQNYILYILIFMILILSTLIPFKEIIMRFFLR